MASTQLKTNLSYDDVTSIYQTANQMRVDPYSLGALMELESNMDANIIGGQGNKYVGVIQFGPGARQEVGLPNRTMTVAEQMPYVSKYMFGRGFKPGMSVTEMYRTVLVGNPGQSGTDSFGTNSDRAAQRMLPGGDLYQRAKIKMELGSGNSNTAGMPGAAFGATNNDVSVGDLSSAFSATFPGRDLSNHKDGVQFAAAAPFVLAAKRMFGASKQQSLPSQPAQLAMSTAGGDLSAGKFSSPTEIYSGEEGHSSYRPDHAGDNSHGHFAYEKPGLAMEAAALLNAHGIQTTELAGVNSVGKHSPNSWHYAKGPKGYGLAFDVPMSQVPVGQEDALYKKMRKILRIA